MPLTYWPKCTVEIYSYSRLLHALEMRRRSTTDNTKWTHCIGMFQSVARGRFQECRWHNLYKIGEARPKGVNSLLYVCNRQPLGWSREGSTLSNWMIRHCQTAIISILKKSRTFCSNYTSMPQHFYGSIQWAILDFVSTSWKIDITWKTKYCALTIKPFLRFSYFVWQAF